VLHGVFLRIFSCRLGGHDRIVHLYDFPAQALS
jgi:hypothetical protein